MCYSYPKGNFKVNQLLDGSISLSPLNQNLMNDLHVSNATSLHTGFPLASRCSDIDHHLSGPNVHA